MIVATAMLIFLLLIFTPIPFSVRLQYVFGQVVLYVWIKVFYLPFANQKFFVDANGVGYTGTVDGYLQTGKQSSQNGVDIVKCITLDSILIYLRNDLSNLTPSAMVAQNAIVSIVTPVVCSLTHCQFGCICNNFADISDLQICVKGSISVAELSFCFIKQGVEKCKHKSTR